MSITHGWEYYSQQWGAIKIRCNICRIKSYISGTNTEDNIYEDDV